MVECTFYRLYSNLYYDYRSHLYLHTLNREYLWVASGKQRYNFTSSEVSILKRIIFIIVDDIRESWTFLWKLSIYLTHRALVLQPKFYCRFMDSNLLKCWKIMLLPSQHYIIITRQINCIASYIIVPALRFGDSRGITFSNHLTYINADRWTCRFHLRQLSICSLNRRIHMHKHETRGHTTFQ